MIDLLQAVSAANAQPMQAQFHWIEADVIFVRHEARARANNRVKSASSIAPMTNTGPAR
jgi:hypothetical protein